MLAESPLNSIIALITIPPTSSIAKLLWIYIYMELTYEPIRRIGLACTNCRRKKARCTGERPVCRRCRRSGLECRFAKDAPVDAQPTPRRRSSTASEQGDEAQGRGSSDRQRVNGNPNSDLEWIKARFDSLEHQLGEIESKLDAIASASHAPQSPASATVITSPKGSYSLPSSSTFQSILDIYFTFCHNQPYSFFHASSLRQKHFDGQLPEYVICAILATSMRFATGLLASSDCRFSAEACADRAWQLLAPLCFGDLEHGDVSVVQAVTLLSIFDFTSGQKRHRLAWVKLGVAVRVAQELRLMNEATTPISYIEQEERRRTFWSLYLLDRLITCGRDRPAAMPDRSCTLHLPSSEHSWDIGLEEPTSTLEHISSRKNCKESDKINEFKVVVTIASVLGRCTSLMLQSSNQQPCDPPWDPRSEWASIYSDLVYIESGVQFVVTAAELLQQRQASPGDLAQKNIAPHFVAAMLCCLCHCLLDHPFLIRRLVKLSGTAGSSSFFTRSWMSGLEYAQKMVTLLDCSRECGYPMLWSFSGYCLVVAGSFHALNTETNGHWDCKESRSFKSCMDHLSYLTHLWPNASLMKRSLSNFSTEVTTVRDFLLKNDETILDETHESKVLWQLVDYSYLSQGKDQIESNYNVDSLSAELFEWQADFDAGVSPLWPS
ncbi:unnamed protein product [Cercospora beticola]|nr:unnamed protein product [Cercospora beticola]